MPIESVDQVASPTIPQAYPDDLRRGSKRIGKQGKILIFGDDDHALQFCELPDDFVCSTAQTHIAHVETGDTRPVQVSCERWR